MGLDKAGHQHPALQIHHPHIATHLITQCIAVTQRHDLAALDQHGIHLGIARIHGQNGTVGKQLHRGRWRIKPAVYSSHTRRQQRQ